MKLKLSELDKFQDEKVPVPNILHFIWIGDSNQANINYIDIWKKSNKDKIIYLWLDESTSLVNLLHDSINKYVINDFSSDKKENERALRNDAFNYIFPRIKKGGKFNALIKEFLNYNKIPYYPPSFSGVGHSIKIPGVIIKDIPEIFIGKFFEFMKFYYYEIILRDNIASASDILRLIIIYIYGGIYIDVDTLPLTDTAFPRLNNYINTEKFVEDDYLLVFKTKCLLNKICHQNYTDEEYFEHYKNEAPIKRKKYLYIKTLIDQDVDDFSIEKIIPLREVFVYKNILAIGSLKRLKGVYFNNFLASHPSSKSIKIILRVMKKRYRFLEKNNCIFNFHKQIGKVTYFTRILTWRTELITKNYCVTSVLTGPGLITEVLLGLAFEIFDVDNSIKPNYIAEFMQSEKYGVALFQHNIDTPEGINSSWRK